MNTTRCFLAAGLIVGGTLAAPSRVTAQHHAGAATAPAAPASGPVELRFTYVPGRHARYTTRSVQNAPAPVGQTVTTAAVDIETVRVEPDGSADQRLHASNVSVSGAAVNAAARQQIAQGLSALSVEYRQGTRGQIVSRQPPTGVAPQFQPLVEGLLQSLDQMSPQLPAQPVAVGASWSDHKTMHLPLGPGVALDMGLDLTYTLRSVRGTGAAREAVLGLAMAMHLPTGTQVQGVAVNGEGTATGEITLSLGRGVVANSSTTGSMTVHVTTQGRSQDVRSTFENEMRETSGAAAGSETPAPAAAPAPAHAAR